MIICLFVELFSCLWPVAQDSGLEWLFSSDSRCVVEFVDGVLCRTLFWKNPGWWAGRREEGVWLEGLVSGEGVATAPRGDIGMGTGS